MALSPSTLDPLRQQLPSWFFTHHLLGVDVGQWLGLIVLIMAAVLGGTLGQWLLLRLGRVLARQPGAAAEGLFAALPGPARLLLALLIFHLFVPLLQLPPAAQANVDLIVRSLLIVAVTWLVMHLITLFFARAETYLCRRITDSNRLRSLQTQLSLPRAVLRIAVVVVGTSLVLLQFDVVRSVGVSLLASASLAGIILGLAAQRTASNLFAGIQLTVSQPIRIGDMVVVENEWGRIEEIGLTNVVVKLWDLRRLVLPVSYFLEKPFQNWTRGDADLIGTVVLHVDYSIVVDDLRVEVARILEATPLWDRRTQGVQVTDLAASSVELRVLVSASDGERLWDLRCLVREKLLAWMQDRQRRAGNPSLSQG
jgi:small-conductance mechanosensitive channel